MINNKGAIVRMNNADIQEIFRQIAAGEKQHGSFLTNFANAITHADAENFQLLKPNAEFLINKYKLKV